MKTINRYLILLVFLPLIIFLGSCAETAENEHLPEYCQTYSGFMSIASKDLYDLVGGITRDDYLTAISVIELEFDVDDPYREVDLSGIQCFQNLTSLTLIGQSFKDISPISALKNIQEITLLNTSVVSIDSFKNLSKIKELNITGTKTLQSVDGVEEMTKLTSLELIDNGIVNIDGLNNLVNLTTLNLSYNEISEFPNINQLTQLTELYVNYNNIHVLGDDLSGLSSLITLEMRDNNICDLSSLDDLTSLESLDLSFNNLGCDGSGESPDFSSLDNASNLKTIKLNDNDLVSIEGLRGLNLPLETLQLENNNIIDISPIGEYTGLKKLVLYGNNIENISDLSGMVGLTIIDLSDNSIVDFSGLLSIENLEDINLSNNLIESIPDLVTLEKEYWPHLYNLDLHSNVLTDISGIEGHSSLRELIISDNGLTVISGLSDLPELEYFEVFWDLPLGEVEDWPEEFELETNPNLISIINNSFNNVPNLPLLYIEDEGLETEIVTDMFDFGFELGESVQILGSINGLISVGDINFSGMDIALIDEFSINLPNLYKIDVSNTNIEDIRFILGNPGLVSLNISDTAVSNLSVISGLNTNDLDELDQVNASNISGDNHLVDSFIELPELSIILLDGTNIISIENSFNSLVELTTFRLDSVELVSIVDSFNDIFDFYTIENTIQINDSKIGIINGSFNGGNYYFIEIIDNLSTGVTEITDSFNDITTATSEGSLYIYGNNFASVSGSFNNGSHRLLGFFDNAGSGVTSLSDSFNNLLISTDDILSVVANNFETVDNSFNGVTAGSLYLYANSISTITNSLFELDVTDELNIQNNNLETLVGLNFVTSVPSFDISNNHLTTVSFIDGIPDLTDLDISNQYNSDTLTLTLSTIDGINNMPGLDNIVMNELLITEIDGFKNIAITEFILNKTVNNEGTITSITSDSFTNSLITELDLLEHNFDNIDFLTNFTNLVDLSLSIDLVDLSYFETAVFEANLETLILENVQDTTNFSSLSEYDDLTFLSFNSLNTLVINNLDGMNSLNSVNFVNRANLTEFNNSFNTMPSLNLSESYLDLYTSLATLNTSFDVYSSGDSVSINGSIDVIDSFNNVGEVILASTSETTINFDALSFDNMAILTIETSEHDSFAILNNYSNLTVLTIETLNKNITDLDNSNITSLIIQETDVLVDTLTLDIASNGSLEFSSLSAGTVTLNTVNDTYDLDIGGGNIVLNLDNIYADLNGTFLDFTLNSANVVQVDLSDYSSQNTIFNTELLDHIYKAATEQVNATTMTVNSLVPTISVRTIVDTLNINDINANDYTINITNGNAYLNSDELNLVVDFTGNNLYAEYDLIETISLLGSLNELILNSNNLGTATLNNTSITTATITSNQALLAVTGSNITNLDISNNSINNLTTSAIGAVVTVASTNNEIFNILANASSLVLNTNNVPEIIFNTTSFMDNLDISNGSSINTLTFNNASITSIILGSSEANIDISGPFISSVVLNMNNLGTISANSSSATYEINSEVVAMDLDMSAQTVQLNNVNMTDLNIQGTSDIGTIALLNTPLVDTITSNSANVTSFNIGSSVATLSVTGSAILNSTVNNNSLVNLTANLGTNNLIVNSTNTGSGSFVLTADTVDFNIALSTVTIDNSSTITSLQLGSTSLSNISAGTANITNLDISDSSFSLDVTGTNITNLDLVTNTNTLFLGVGLTTTVEFTHGGAVDVSISTNTKDITINSTTDIVLTSSTLTSSTFNLAVNNATLYLSAGALDYSIDGTLNNLLINSTSLNNLNIGVGFNANQVRLEDTNVTNLDFSNGTIESYIMGGNTTSLILLGNDLDTIILDLPNLNNLTTNSTVVGASLFVTASSTSLDLNGSIDNATLDEATLASINLTDITIDNLIINSDSLTLLNTSSSVSNTLEITTNNDNFNLTTDVPALDYTSAVTHNLNLNTTSVTNQSITTNVDSITLNAVPTSITITGNNINSLSGTADNIALSSTDNGSLTLDIITTSVTVNNTSLTSIDTLLSTVDTLVISTNTNNFNLTTDIASIDYTSAITDNLNLTTTSVANLNIDTNVDSITFNAPSTNVVILGANINNVTGSVDTVLFTENVGFGTLTLDLDASTVTVDNTTYTQIDTTGVRTITTMTVGGSTLEAINNNTVSITNLDVTDTAASINIDSQATNIDINSLTASNTVTLIYTSANTVNLTISNLDDLNVTAALSSNVILNGDVVNLVLSGNSINSVVTTSFTASNKYTMNDTLIDDLSFISVGLVASLVELEVNTLDVANVTSIVEDLRDSGIILFSPIISQDIYDDFYNTEFDDLTAQEVLDSVRYDGFRDTAILNAFNEIRTNTYFQYITDPDLNTSIDGQSYGDMQFYLDSYTAGEGTTEAQLEIDNGAAFVQAIRDSIQATLDETVLVIVELDLTNSVDQSIIDDSNTHATTESGLIGFTIG
ncbi:MAG: Internalin-A precursor [Candidatus Izimaplasma bacterium HR2]|nr:MAG: Internalin-A precursor [Candidatus Izimaplasma bacterium HR2]